MKHAVRVLVAAASLLIAPSAFGQTLGWSTPVSNNSAIQPVGGTSGRNGVATTAAFNNEVWVAYATTTCTADSSGDCYLVVGHNTGGASTTFENSALVNVSPIGYAAANSNPALIAANGSLWLAWNTATGEHYIASSQDGLNWTTLGNIIGVASTVYSPSFAVNPSNPTILYIGYMDATFHTPVLCTYDTNNANNQSCQSLTGLRTMNFNPGLAFFNGLLYMGFEDRGDSHCLYFYKYDPSANSFTFWNPISCGEQTSTAPSLATFRGDLYVAFRSNDSSQKFTVRVSTTGNDLAFRQQPGYSMNGPASLLDLNQLQTPQNVLFNNFAQSNLLYTSIGQ